MSEKIVIDSEEVEEQENQQTPKSDFVDVSKNFLNQINTKLALFMFLVGMIIFSDLFIEKIISRFDGAVEGLTTTTKGTIIQLTLYSIVLIMIDLMIQWGWL